MNRRSIRATLAATLVALTVAACSNSGGSSSGASSGGAGGKSPIKIGFIGPFSGNLATFGAAIQYAPALVEKKINDAGGINGHPIQFIKEDSAGSPAQAVTLVRQLATQDHVVAIIGPYFSGEFQSAEVVAKGLNVPIMTPAAAVDNILDGGRPDAFRIGFNDTTATSTALQAFKASYPQVKKLVVVGDSQTAVSANMLKSVWPKVLPAAGLQLTETIGFPTATVDFAPIVARIKASGADGIAMSALAPAGPKLIAQLRQGGVTLPIVSSSHLETVPIMPKLVGTPANGIVMSQLFSPANMNNPTIKAWVASYAAAEAGNKLMPAGNPIGYAGEVQWYDAMMLMVQGLKTISNPGNDSATAKALTNYLNGLKSYQGVVAGYTADGNGNFLQAPQASIARDGQWVNAPS